MVSPLLMVSVAERRVQHLDGPRRDFMELARLSRGELLHEPDGPAKNRLLRRFMGAHVRLAWTAARRVSDGRPVFADGEHCGLPLLLFCALRRRNPGRVVMLGHFVAPRWKRALLWATTRLGTRGELLVHSVEQARAVERVLGHRWRVRVVPYQADTDFWQPTGTVEAAPEPLVVAVGAEHRDYATLVDAARDLRVQVVIAAGSHWARETAHADSLPANVTFLNEPLGFAELRLLYERAALVVVPLEDVSNQSGVTTILEAMAMGRPVVVTATRGQKEVVEGPLVTAGGCSTSWLDRGPSLVGGQASPVGGPATGLYVPVGDARAMQAAIRWLLEHPREATSIGAAARRSAELNFGIERYAATLANALLGSVDGPTNVAMARAKGHA